MSEPWPPAFIRTAPPTDPGTPTAHSKPVRPASTVWRASTGRATAAPAVTPGGGLDGDGPEPVGVDHDGHAGEAGVGHQQVRAPPDDQHLEAGGGHRLGHRRQVAGSRAITPRAAGPPTR